MTNAEKNEMKLTQKICNNVKYLALIENKQIGEVEKAIGVSVGYFSRTLKHGVNIPLAKVVKLAEYFKIYIDSLICHDYEVDYLDRQIEVMKSRLDEIEEAKAQLIEKSEE